MFEGEQDAEKTATNIVEYFSSHDQTYTHSRHISIETCKKYLLKVDFLEDDPSLQDLVLTTHHAFMHTFNQTGAVKIIENHLGSATVVQSQIQSSLGQMMFPLQSPPESVDLSVIPILPADALAKPPIDNDI